MAKNTSVVIGDHFEQFIGTQVKTGRFSSASEVVKGWSAGATVGRSDSQHLLDVPAGNEERFLAPESVTLLPDLDQKVRDRLDDVHTEKVLYMTFRDGKLIETNNQFAVGDAKAYAARASAKTNDR